MYEDVDLFQSTKVAIVQLFRVPCILSYNIIVADGVLALLNTFIWFSREIFYNMTKGKYSFLYFRGV
jgi:hypothetical protein